MHHGPAWAMPAHAAMRDVCLRGTWLIPAAMGPEGIATAGVVRPDEARMGVMPCSMPGVSRFAGPGQASRSAQNLSGSFAAWLGAVSSCPPDRQVCGRLALAAPDSCLPDQPSHHIPGEQRLGHISLDERPAVDHLVLLQARVPLPDL